MVVLGAALTVPGMMWLLLVCCSACAAAAGAAPAVTGCRAAGDQASGSAPSAGNVLLQVSRQREKVLPMARSIRSGDAAPVSTGTAAPLASTTAVSAASTSRATPESTEDYETFGTPAAPTSIATSARTTVAGCSCRSTWTFREKECTDSCCNPDDDPKGAWCYVADAELCHGIRWGYCAAVGGTTTVTTAPPFGVRTTRSGCTCKKEWEYHGSLCGDYCCNPDSDVGGEWCFLQDPVSCTDDLFGGHWGYCAPLPTSVPGTTTALGSSPKVPSTAWGEFQLLQQVRQAGYTCPGGTVFPPNAVELQFDCRLWRAATLHCTDMVANDYLDSISPVDNSTPADRARAQGTKADAENVCAVTATANATLALFLSSDPHCRTIMNASWTVAAVGYAQGGIYRHYWTQLFASAVPAPVDSSCCRDAVAGVQAGTQTAASTVPSTLTGVRGSGLDVLVPEMPAHQQDPAPQLAPSWHRPS